MQKKNYPFLGNSDLNRKITERQKKHPNSFDLLRLTNICRVYFSKFLLGQTLIYLKVY